MRLPARLPESFDELAALLKAAVTEGYEIAVENVIADENKVGFAYINWTAADQRLAEVLAEVRPVPQEP